MSTRSAIATAALLAAVCAPQRRANLSVSAQMSTGASSTASAPTAGTGSLDLGNGITVDRIRINFTQVALDCDDHDRRRTGGTGGGGGGGGGHGPPQCRGEDAPEFGPVTADLSAGSLGKLEQLAKSSVSVGDFQHVMLSIGPATAGAGSSSALVDMAARQASLIADGTVDGVPFSFVSSLVVELDVATDVVVSEGIENNVTVRIDPSSWFGGTGAARLDPTTPSNQAAIESNIQGSITAFEDD